MSLGAFGICVAVVCLWYSANDPTRLYPDPDLITASFGTFCLSLLGYNKKMGNGDGIHTDGY